MLGINISEAHSVILCSFSTIWKIKLTPSQRMFKKLSILVVFASVIGTKSFPAFAFSEGKIICNDVIKTCSRLLTFFTN